jgi:putative nucleotidyltransferase with HDIG domain
MNPQYMTIDLEELLVGEPLPAPLFIYVDFRFVTYRAEGDSIDRESYDRLQTKRIQFLFIQESDRQLFTQWVGSREAEKTPPLAPAQKDFPKAREDAHRKVMDIFAASHPEKVVSQAIEASKKLVDEVCKFPFAVQSLAQLQNYSKGTVDHSVNVSILSVYLAIQMGYSHTLILQHVGLGGLMHDVGKPRVPFGDDDSPETLAKKMQDHPTFSLRVLESEQSVPNEVRMIVAQHHEYHDGTGFPKGLRGNQIYDLARIVCIANVFDELVGDGKGTLVERQRAAIAHLDQQMFRKFDPQKLEKALKILKLGV